MYCTIPNSQKYISRIDFLEILENAIPIYKEFSQNYLMSKRIHLSSSHHIIYSQTDINFQRVMYCI